MAWKPRRPRWQARSSDPSPTVASRALVNPADPRQADLFAPGQFVSPMLATLAERVPTGPLWQFEIKHDGYRVQAHVGAGAVRLYTRGGYDWADRMPAIAAAMAALPVTSAIIDGEAITEGADGTSDFFALHAALADKRAPLAFLMAFDMLALDDRDLRERPLAERRAMLAETLIGAGPGIELSEHLSGDGEGMFRAACAMGLEGVMAKRVDRPYRSGRSDDWRKIKCTKVEAFAVVGFDPRGRSGVAALKLARLDDAGGLATCGSVGSGISEAASRELRAALDAGRPVVAEVEHRGVTPAGELRHPVFKGWHVEG